MTATSLKALMLAGATLLGAGATLALPTAAQAQAYVNVQIGTPPRRRASR